MSDPYRTDPPKDSIGPTASFQLANELLPRQAGGNPIQLWSELTGGAWSSWSGWAALSDDLRDVRIALEGGSRVIVRERFELVIVCFPPPKAAREPHFAVLARCIGALRLRSFVFERGANPDNMAMAELRYLGPTEILRVARPLESEPTLERCIERTVVVLQDPRTDLVAAVEAVGGAQGRAAELREWGR